MRALVGQAHMPMLQRIYVHYADGTASRAAGGAPPLVLDITPGRFPSLQDISLTGAAAALTPSLACPLRCLEMGNPKGPQVGLPLAPFLDCLASFSRLETLKVRRCFAVPTAPLGGPGARPTLLPRLKDIRIQDHPSNVNQIISRLAVPSSAKVNLSGELQGASLQQYCSAFMAMLPRDLGACLPALRSIAKIEVLCDRTECAILGTTHDQPDNHRQITLELFTDLLRDFNHEDDDAGQAARGALFHTMIQTIAYIFPGIPAASRLKVFGPVNYIPLETWGSVLVRFRSLRRLMVDDATLRRFPYELLNALLSPLPPANQTVICPRLEELEIFGDCGEDEDGEEGDPLRALFECLERRKTHGGGGLLSKLNVELFSDTILEEERLERYRVRFAPLALECKVANQVQNGLRIRD
ncbi:hypothetical protein TRAPUB_10577 [Trametes pubescens]|uniref:F-box domain-containing protein n=1 Tax=Trametes pubescens TaxID=154538 RepID=A0A1M2VZC3_TRAPU|nr:hypothetical protein TRAPUB_10577 [Trametes pubescens]